MALPTQNVAGLQWQNYTSDPANLIAPIDCDFTTYSIVSVTPSGFYGQVGQRVAAGVVIDNLLHGMAVVVTVGPLVETVPPYTKQTIALAGTTNAVSIASTGAVVRASFYFGTFQGSSSGANYYAAQVQAGLAVATGMIYPFAGQSAAIPVGYLACDGTAVSRSTYSGLFSIIGTIWGQGDGTTTFNLPNLNGRAMIGAGTNGADTYQVGQYGGTPRLTLASAQMPVHTHVLTDPGHMHVLSDPGHTHPYFINNGGGATGGIVRGPNTTNNWTASGVAFTFQMSGALGLTDPAQGGTYQVKIDNAKTGITLGSAMTGISIAYAGGANGTGDGSNAVTQPVDIRNPFAVVTFIIKT